MKFHIIGEELYYGKYRVGHVTYIDYRDNGRHGYSIGRVSNKDLLEKFQQEATILFPNAENQYIDYLDLLRIKEKELETPENVKISDEIKKILPVKGKKNKWI